MKDNYVVLEIDTYNDLKKKADSFDELVKNYGEEIEIAIKRLINKINNLEGKEKEND